MSLREDAIRAYREKKATREAKATAEKNEHVERRITYAKEAICAAFTLDECPYLAITYNDVSYWPKMEFEIDGIKFLYNLDSKNIELEVACQKCGQEWHNIVRFETKKDGIRDLTDLGYELCALERHDCPADKPPYAPPPPPRTVAYQVDSVEARLLDTIREYVFDIVEQEREG